MVVPADARESIRREAEQFVMRFGPESLAILLQHIGETKPDVARRQQNG